MDIEFYTNDYSIEQNVLSTHKATFGSTKEVVKLWSVIVKTEFWRN